MYPPTLSTYLTWYIFIYVCIPSVHADRCTCILTGICMYCYRSVDETLRLVQAFQYTDQHGEVCPAGWKPGQDTIIPNPKDKLNYFTKHGDGEL